MKRICVIGTGYVGLVTGACLADLGNPVVCVDNDQKKISLLKRCRLPIYEPGLEGLVKKTTQARRLTFTSDLAEGVGRSEVIFIAVGTPPQPDGSADLRFVEAVTREVARHLRAYAVIVEKSTVPVETGDWIERMMARYAKRNVPFDVASNPEFLREGSAIHDFLHPDRIVIGVKTKRAEGILTELYRPLKVPILVTDIKSAELIKHASNSFLATKISFINAVANVCERVGADVSLVAKGMGMDHRIGRAFLDAGIGFGGFCFPKDLEAFLWISRKLGYNFQLLEEVKRINEAQRRSLVQKIEQALWILRGKTIGILGLAFKPNTDDLRYAPSLEVIQLLQEKGTRLRVYDPVAMPKAKPLLKGVSFCRDAYMVARGADCLAIITEWNEFRELDLQRVKRLMAQPIVVDGRNIYDPQVMRQFGFQYYGIGR